MNAGRAARRLPGARAHRLSARGPAAEDDFLDAAGRRARGAGRQDADGIVALVGFPERADDVYNAAAVLADGEVDGRLPQDVPAELRRLRRAALLPVGHRAGDRSSSTASPIGLTICEDIWEPGPPATTEALAGAQVIVNLSASPYHARQGLRARAHARPARARRPRGGRVLQHRRRPGRAGVRRRTAWPSTRTAACSRARRSSRRRSSSARSTRARSWPQRLRDTRHRANVRRAAASAGPRSGDRRSPGSSVGCARRADARSAARCAEPLEPEARGVRGARHRRARLRRKNGFEQVVLGLSGGIDSALVALIAADALGAERVMCVVDAVPLLDRGHAARTPRDRRATSAWSSSRSRSRTRWTPTSGCSREPFEGREPDVAEENLQARIRGNL